MTRTAPIRAAGAFVAGALLLATPARAQNRGVYPLGMSASNSGAMPAPGLTYANMFLSYSRDEQKGPDGETLATGHHSVLMDMNSLVWTSGKTIAVLRGARYSASATVPIANNSLTSDVQGALSGGGGLADCYFLPLILGWKTKRADFKAMYGFLAPSGRFNAGAFDNVGSGYWTHTLSAGQTFDLTEDRAWTLSAFEMYELHTRQEGTDIHPGQNVDIDYSLTRAISVNEDLRFQVGLAGYGQWQTTDKSGPTITPSDAAAHYRVNALGFVFNALLPARKVSLGAKYFEEFSNRSTYEGYSVQISASITF